MAFLSKIHSNTISWLGEVKRAVIWSVFNLRKHWTHLNFSPCSFHPSCDTPGARKQLLKMNIKTGMKAHGSQCFSDWGGNNRRMRGTKWVPCDGRQIPAVTAVVMVQLQDQSCFSFYWDKLILIVHLHFHLRRKHTNIDAACCVPWALKLNVTHKIHFLCDKDCVLIAVWTIDSQS